jgi:hypothetical protein
MDLIQTTQLNLAENAALNRTYYDVYGQYRRNGELYYWGSDNLAPDKLIELKNVSPTHNALLDLKNYMLESYTVDATPLELELFNKFNKAPIESLIRNTIKDYVLFNTFAFKICPTSTQYNLIDYIPTRQIRYSSMEDEDGKPTKIWVSRDWSNLRVRVNKKYEIPLLSRLHDTNELDTNYAYVYRDDDLYTDIYQTPNYFSGINNILFESEISKFNLAATRNGWAPRLAITTFQSGAPEELRQLATALDAEYRGTENAGKIIFMNAVNPDMAPKIQEINYSLQADSYLASVNSAREYILSAHKCTSPALAGLSINGGFEGQGTALLAAYSIYDQMVVANMRTVIMREINKVLEMSNFDIRVNFTAKPLKITEDINVDSNV